MPAHSRLTQMVKAGGCGSKIGPGQLRSIITGLPKPVAREILYGLGAGDDAAVYELGPDLAIVQTVDFFTPIVDDPFDFGAIAAANAISDCYALGAKPITALCIVGFPKEADPNILREILRGGIEKAKEAEVSIVGGHSIADPEPKYGLAITGLVNPKNMVLNSGAKIGDGLVLTKKIGTGIVTNALRRADLREDFSPPTAAVVQEAILSMKTLNNTASRLMKEFHASACTDVTGFGLLGHARNIAEASNVCLQIRYSLVPKLDEVEKFALDCSQGGGERNRQWLDGSVTLDEGLGDKQLAVLSDPQTSGPLLIALPMAESDNFIRALKNEGVVHAALIGEVIEGRAGTTEVVP